MVEAVKIAEPRSSFYIYSMGLDEAGKAKTIASCDGNAGSIKIEGFVNRLACSKRSAVTVPSEARGGLLIPESAASFSYVYGSQENEDFVGGFVYFDSRMKVVAVNYLSQMAPDDWPYKIMLGNHVAATPDEYSQLHEYILQGSEAGHGERLNAYTKHAWFPPGVIDSAPHGGWVYQVKKGKTL